MTILINYNSKGYTELEKLGYGDFLEPPVEFDIDEVDEEFDEDDEYSDEGYDLHLGDDDE